LHVRQRALILLLADRRTGERTITNDLIATLADVDRRTVTRVRATFVRKGLAETIKGTPRTARTLRKLTNEQERRLLALLETPPPAGYPRWTVRTIADAARDMEEMPIVSRELVRRVLKARQAMPILTRVDAPAN
jgi:hypothetical protein